MEKRNILDHKIFNSRAKGTEVKASEKWLGYLLGPQERYC